MKKLITVLILLILISINSVNGECKEQPSLNKNSFQIIKGKTYQLSIKNAKEQSGATWKSKDNTIAKVNKNGLVTGVGKGETTILCSVRIGDSNYNLSAKVKVLAKPNKVDNIKIKTSFERTSAGSQERMVIKGYKEGKLRWTYKTKYASLTELDSFSKVYKNNNMLYFRDVTSVVTLDAKTGKVIWKTRGCGAGNLYFDKAGFVYVTGFYGPDIFCADINGNIQYIKSYDNNLYWAYDLKIKGDILYIYYDCEISDKIKIPYEMNFDEWGYEQAYIKVNKKTGKILN